MANLREEAYLIVLQESKNDFVYGTTLSDYRNIIIPGVLSRIGPNPTSSEPELISVDGNPAIAYTLSGAIDNIKVTYYIVLTENNNDFFQVFTWSLTSRFKQNEQTLRDVAQTFTSQ